MEKYLRGHSSSVEISFSEDQLMMFGCVKNTDCKYDVCLFYEHVGFYKQEIHLPFLKETNPLDTKIFK